MVEKAYTYVNSLNYNLSEYYVLEATLGSVRLQNVHFVRPAMSDRSPYKGLIRPLSAAQPHKAANAMLRGGSTISAFNFHFTRNNCVALMIHHAGTARCISTLSGSISS